MGSQEGLSCQVSLPSHQQILTLYAPDTHGRPGPVLGMPAPRASRLASTMSATCSSGHTAEHS